MPPATGLIAIPGHFLDKTDQEHLEDVINAFISGIIDDKSRADFAAYAGSKLAIEWSLTAFTLHAETLRTSDDQGQEDAIQPLRTERLGLYDRQVRVKTESLDRVGVQADAGTDIATPVPIGAAIHRTDAVPKPASIPKLTGATPEPKITAIKNTDSTSEPTTTVPKPTGERRGKRESTPLDLVILNPPRVQESNADGPDSIAPHQLQSQRLVTQTPPGNHAEADQSAQTQPEASNTSKHRVPDGRPSGSVQRERTHKSLIQDDPEHNPTDRKWSDSDDDANLGPLCAGDRELLRENQHIENILQSRNQVSLRVFPGP